MYVLELSSTMLDRDCWQSTLESNLFPHFASDKLLIDAVPPGDPVIETRSGVILREGLAGPFNDGDPLTLHCYTGDVGRPRANLVWVAHDGRVIDDTFSYEHIDTHHHQTVVVRNTLEINALNRDHLLTTLACQASNNNITAPSQTSITLDLNCEW